MGREEPRHPEGNCVIIWLLISLGFHKHMWAWKVFQDHTLGTKRSDFNVDDFDTKNVFHLSETPFLYLQQGALPRPEDVAVRNVQEMRTLQWFSIILIRRPFNAVPCYVVTSNSKIIFTATS